jgi:tetratricopeptide (TPR) repeat protein
MPFGLKPLGYFERSLIASTVHGGLSHPRGVLMRCLVLSAVGILLSVCLLAGIGHASPPQHAPACASGFDPFRPRERLRDAFERRDFDALEAQLREIRQFHDSRYCSDRPLLITLNALRDGSPRLTATFDAWVAAKPASAFARVARGAHFDEQALQARGRKASSETHPQQFTTAEMILSRAMQDFDEAVRLDPELGLARGARLKSSRLATPFLKRVEQFTEDQKRVPSSYAFYIEAIGAFEPRWGGSANAVRGLAKIATRHADENPSLVLLETAAECVLAFDAGVTGSEEAALARLAEIRRSGLPLDPDCIGAEASVLRRLKRYAEHVEAHEAYRTTVGFANRGTGMAADSLRMLKRYDQALELYRQAVRFRSDDANAHCGMADVLRVKGQLEQALAHVDEGIAMDPNFDYCRNVKRRVLTSMGDSSP